MKPLRKLYSRFVDKFNLVRDNENLTRFLLSSKNFSTQNRMVKWRAYLPRRGETSVYRADSLSAEEIWHVGDRYVARVSGREIKGSASLKAQLPRQQNLDVLAETSTHKLHANIVNWPAADDEIRMIALELADASELMLKDQLLK